MTDQLPPTNKLVSIRTKMIHHRDRASVPAQVDQRMLKNKYENSLKVLLF